MSEEIGIAHEVIWSCGTNNGNEQIRYHTMEVLIEDHLPLNFSAINALTDYVKEFIDQVGANRVVYTEMPEWGRGRMMIVEVEPEAEELKEHLVEQGKKTKARGLKRLPILEFQKEKLEREIAELKLLSQVDN